MRARVHLPARARAGEVITVKTLVAHPMETGYARDVRGDLVPRHIVTEFTCWYGGREVFRAAFRPAVAANPFLEFHLRATVSGRVTFRWRTDRGEETALERTIEVA